MFTLRSVLAILAAGSALVLTANADVCECINLKNGISHPKMTKKCCAQVSGNWDSGAGVCTAISASHTGAFITCCGGKEKGEC